MKYYSIMIGPNGIWLKINNNKKVIKDLFIEKSVFSEHKEDIKNFFEQDKKSNIYIFLDNLTQNYTRKHFPLLNPIDLHRISERRFNMEIPATDLRAKFFLGKNKEKKVYEYLFISASMDDELNMIFNFLQSIPNMIFGIYMVPLEAQNLLNIVFKKSKISKKNKPELVILLLETRVGGFRQVSFKDGKLLFTRLLSDDNNELSKDFRTKFLFFEEDIKKTISFIKRFVPYLDYSKLALITITNDNVSSIFEKMNLQNIAKYNYTIDNFNKIFLKKYTKENDVFCENFIEYIVVFKKYVHSFIIDKVKYIKNLYNISYCIKYIFYFIFCLFLYFSISFLFVFLKYKTNANNLKANLKSIELEFKKEKESDLFLKSEDPYFIIEMAKLYNFYVVNYKNPFKYNEYINAIFDKTDTLITSIRWKLNNFNYLILGSSGANDSIEIDFNLVNESGSLDDLLNNYENFKINVKTELEDLKYLLQNIEKNKLNFNDKYYLFESSLKIITESENDRKITEKGNKN